MSITKFNKSNAFFSFKDTEGFGYYGLEQLNKEFPKDHVFIIKALYINANSIYGKSPLLVLEDRFVNLPNHLVDEVQEITQDEKLVQDINDGKVGFTIYSYEQKKYKRICYSINWVELE